MLRIYVAAPYADAPRVRGVHGLLEQMGVRYTSFWAELMTGAESLADTSARVQRAQWRLNHQHLSESDAMLVLSDPSAGAETFAEVGHALALELPVLWVGARRILSCYAPTCVLCESEHAALMRIKQAARGGTRETYRAMLLAVVDGPVCPRCGAAGCKDAKFVSGDPAWECRACGGIFGRSVPFVPPPGDGEPS